MNQVDKDFLTKHKDLFSGRNIVVGGLNVNGTIKEIIDTDESIDIRDGDDVTTVMDACNLIEVFGWGSFNNVICMNTLEHMKRWGYCMYNMYYCLKRGGHMLITVPTINKGRHNHPNDYWRFTIQELKDMFPYDKVIDTMEMPRKKKHEIIVWLGIIIQKTTGRGIHLDWTPAKVKGGHVSDEDIRKNTKKVKAATIVMPPLIAAVKR